jgi:hypothetical protein
MFHEFDLSQRAERARDYFGSETSPPNTKETKGVKEGGKD